MSLYITGTDTRPEQDTDAEFPTAEHDAYDQAYQLLHEVECVHDLMSYVREKIPSLPACFQNTANIEAFREALGALEDGVLNDVRVTLTDHAVDLAARAAEAFKGEDAPGALMLSNDLLALRDYDLIPENPESALSRINEEIAEHSRAASTLVDPDQGPPSDIDFDAREESYARLAELINDKNWVQEEISGDSETRFEHAAAMLEDLERFFRPQSCEVDDDDASSRISESTLALPEKLGSVIFPRIKVAWEAMRHLMEGECSRLSEKGTLGQRIAFSRLVGCFRGNMSTYCSPDEETEFPEIRELTDEIKHKISRMLPGRGWLSGIISR